LRTASSPAKSANKPRAVCEAPSRCSRGFTRPRPKHQTPDPLPPRRALTPGPSPRLRGGGENFVWVPATARTCHTHWHCRITHPRLKLRCRDTAAPHRVRVQTVREADFVRLLPWFQPPGRISALPRAVPSSTLPVGVCPVAHR